MDKSFAIFDMDGTLVDSMGRWDDVLVEYLQDRGVSPVPDELLQQTASMTMMETLTLVIRRFGLDDTPEMAQKALQDIMEGHYRQDIELKPGVAELLAALDRRGVRMCVVSATPEPLIELCLTRLGVRKYFQFVLSCDSVGAGKDRPDIYYTAAERLGAAPEDAAVFEDSLSAVQTAKGAGFYVVGVWDEAETSRWETIRRLADETRIFGE